jgi:hypothetical protein
MEYTRCKVYGMLVKCMVVQSMSSSSFLGELYEHIRFSKGESCSMSILLFEHFIHGELYQYARTLSNY